MNLLANIMLDPLDQELEKRGHRFARYADDFLILVRSARAARRVMQSVIAYVEGRLGLVVNRQKSQAAPLARCTFLGFALRRRVRLCYWKQWQRPRTRRRHLISLGIHPDEVMKASRCRRGYWWVSGNGIGSGAPAPAGLRPCAARIPLAAPSGSSVQRALNNAWLREQGVPDLKAQWIELHYGKRNPNWDPASVNLTGTA